MAKCGPFHCNYLLTPNFSHLMGFGATCGGVRSAGLGFCSPSGVGGVRRTILQIGVFGGHK